MNGAEFVALVPLYGEVGELLAAAGDTCERVPVTSLGWLEADKLIERRAAAPTPAARQGRKVKE